MIKRLFKKIKKWYRNKTAMLLAPFIVEVVYRILDKHDLGIKIMNKDIKNWALEKEDDL